jgi:lipopolysaccharide biosynthesis regulator YciM
MRPALWTPRASLRYSPVPNDEEIAFGGASNDMTVQTPGGQTEGSTTLVAQLRAESAAQQEKGLQALLLHECGVLEETNGEEPAAARDYLAAFNADPQFREPLESLVRILTRRKSVKNLGKLLDALCRAASSPDEKARACWERAAYLQAHEQNVSGAQELLLEALADSPEDPALWVEVELCAAKERDVDGRMRALDARAQLASDSTWKALLFIDLAELAASSGDASRAYDALGAAAALEGRAQFRTQVVLEQIAAKEDNLGELARALEGQAYLVEEAIEDAARGDATGVPRYMRRPEYAADAWLRAANIKRRTGDGPGAAALLERAGQRLPESALIARARLGALEAAGDVEGAAAIAKQQLEQGVAGPGAAALWLRLAEAAVASSDRDGALSALQNALQSDKTSVLARTLEIDLLADGKAPEALAASYDAMAESLGEGAPRGRAYLVAAYLWAAEAGSHEASRGALGRAAKEGVPAGVLARVARSIAALRGDTTWYEQATRDLLAAAGAGGGPDAAEQPSLWFELGRSALLRGDRESASTAFAKLAASDEAGGTTAWLGRVLAAYALDLAPKSEGEAPARPASTLEDLAKVEPDAGVARALFIVAALRRVRAGDDAGARSRLRELHTAAPGDTVVAVFLSELERRAGDAAAAAAALTAAAQDGEDGDLAGALRLEAALLLWRAGDRTGATEQLEAAIGQAPRAAATLLGWALRGAAPDTAAGRRRALDVASDAGADPVFVALERFGLEIVAGEADDAAGPLETVENEGTGDLGTAAFLARLVFPAALTQRSSVDRALDRLDELGSDAAAIARAERFRLARVMDQDRALAVTRAADWAQADPKLHAALEWIGASLAAEDREAEVTARRAAAAHFAGPARAALEASAAVVALLDQPNVPLGFVQSAEAPAQLVNLELALPGCDPRRRAAALHGLGSALGADAQLDAIALAAWSDLAAGNPDEARRSFGLVVEARPDDLASWEGIRTASEALGDHVQVALACAQLGSLCTDNPRAAVFWEQAGTTLLEHTDAKDDAEIAFERAFDREPRRAVAFDKLFRAVRGRNEDDRLLGIIEKRLDVSEDDMEIGKLYWERARVLRKKGDIDGALAALENVTMLEPDHVGALALMGEVYITRGNFAEAAPSLARLAQIEQAPRQQRLMSGLAAVDLFDKKLGQLDKALEVLVALHGAGLSTPAVRERLAAVAARAGAWKEATGILEQLMVERDKPEGRIEAARLAMAIMRDKLDAPKRAEAAVKKLLDESPDDGEGIDFVLATPFEAPFKQQLLGRAKQTIVASLARNPVDRARVENLAKLAQFYQDTGLRQATLGALVALGKSSAAISDELGKLDARITSRPQIALNAQNLAQIADPEDGGPIAELFVIMAETVMLALGPSLVSLGVTKKDRIDARGAPPLRVAISEWMGAIGITTDFDLYIGGSNPRGVHAIAGEQPAIVLGSAITEPFDAATRSAVAREVFALKRGTTAVRSRDDNTIASLVAAASIEAGVNVPVPQYAVFGEVQRAVKKEIPRKVRKAIPELCQQIAQSGVDARHFAQVARRSIDRMAVMAAGDASIVLSDICNVPRDQLGGVVGENERARRLLGFVLSPSYLELRKTLGMGVR